MEGPDMHKFRLAFYFQSNKIALDNYLTQDNMSSQLQLSNGLALWIGRGSYVFNAPPPPGAKDNKKQVKLSESIDDAILEEIRITIQDMFHVDMSVVRNEHSAVLETTSPVESVATVPGTTYQRVYRVTRTVKTADYEFLKLDLSLAGNRPFESLRQEIFSELADVYNNLFSNGGNDGGQQQQ